MYQTPMYIDVIEFLLQIKFLEFHYQDYSGLPTQGYSISKNQQGISLGLLLLDPILQKAQLHQFHIHLSMLQSSEDHVNIIHYFLEML